MKTDIKLLDIKGFKTPNYSERKGDLFKKAMDDITFKIAEKRRIKNNSVAIIQKHKTELEEIKHKIVMADDEIEIAQYKNRRKQIEEEMQNTDDYSSLDIDAYARKLINDPAIQKLKKDAEKEYTQTLEIASSYTKELEKHYNNATKLLNEFSTGYRSESSYRQANARFNEYIN